MKNRTRLIAIPLLLVLVAGTFWLRAQSRTDTGIVIDSEGVAPPGAALGIPRMVSLGAGACVPCRMMEPIREELIKEYAGKLHIDFIDVWKDRESGEVYGIRTIPTLVFFAPDGRELARREGFTPKDDILQQWKELGYPL
jgi:thioredoxin 1